MYLQLSYTVINVYTVNSHVVVGAPDMHTCVPTATVHGVPLHGATHMWRGQSPHAK